MSKLKAVIDEKINSVKAALDKSQIYDYRETMTDAIDKAKEEIERDLESIYRDGVNDLNQDNPWLLIGIGAAGVLLGFMIGLFF